MEWTTEKPTKPGWYWLKSNYAHSESSDVEVVWVFKNPGAKDCGVMSTNGWCVAAGKIAGEWAGPIPEPTERTEGK